MSPVFPQDDAGDGGANYDSAGSAGSAGSEELNIEEEFSDADTLPGDEQGVEGQIEPFLNMS